MNKWGNIVCVAGLLACFLFGCKGQTEAVETTAPPTEPPIMLTEQELYKKFEFVYDDCGASASEDAEQIAKELSALNKKATADTKEWPESYETQYKTWRTNTIKERAETVAAEYEQIIGERTLYEQGAHGLWDTRAGLCYADYLDVDLDGKNELLLLTTTTDNMEDGVGAVLEIWGDEKGHSVKTGSQTFVFPFGMSIGLNENDTGFFLTISSGDGVSTDLDICYKLERTGLTAIDAAIASGHGFYYAAEMSDPAIYTFETRDAIYDCFSICFGDEITEEQYVAAKNRCTAKTPLVNLGVESTNIANPGVLPIDKLAPVPKIEIDGEPVELSVIPNATSGVFVAPLRDVLDAMGIAVYANSDVSVILASTKKDTLVMAKGDFSHGIEELWSKSDSWYYCFNGGNQNQITIWQSDGKTIAPIQEIVGLFGASSQWDSEAKTMKIEGAIPDGDRMSGDELKKIAAFDLKQASQAAIRKGHKALEDLDELPTGGSTEDFSSDVDGGLAFKNGKAVWTLYAVEREEHYPYGFYAELYRVDVASDGAVTAYPDKKAYTGAGQF